MSKNQVPTVGGIRKVIRLQDNSATLTTIAEATAQLAALVTQLQQLVNTGGGNIGTGNEASISLGPGLSGGGTLVGNVPINLVQPPALIAEDGIDGDPGMQGIPGPRGLPGLPGATWFAEDGADGDIGIGLPGTTGTIGSQGIQGAAGAQGQSAPWFAEDAADNDSFGVMPVIPRTSPVVFSVANPPMLFADDFYGEELVPHPLPNSVGPFAITGPCTITAATQQFPLVVTSMIVAGGIQAIGPSPVLSVLDTGSNAAFFVLQAINTGWSLNFGWNTSAPGNAALQINGVGSLIITQVGGLTAGIVIKSPNAPGSTALLVSGSTTGSPIIVNGGAGTAVFSMTSSGAATFSSSVAIKGATPAVVAGTTALGITTTVTVITTAGGIALPALASTFGVINWNGVQYGVPLFAL